MPGIQATGKIKDVVNKIRLHIVSSQMKQKSSYQHWVMA